MNRRQPRRRVAVTGAAIAAAGLTLSFVSPPLVWLGGAVALAGGATMIWALLTPAVDPSCCRDISDRRRLFSHDCEEGRHGDCSALADVWGFEQGAVIACDCDCHPPGASEGAMEAELARRERENLEMKKRYAVSVRTRAEWRAWLAENHDRKAAACLLYYIEGRKLTFQDATDEALCFGWVPETVEAADRTQLFQPRKKGSYWAPYHRARYSELVQSGLMTVAGVAVGPDTEAPPPNLVGRHS